MKEYKVPLGNVAQTLADGRTVAPGERVKLSDEDVSDNGDLFSQGKLIAVSDAGEELADKSAASYDRKTAGAEEDLEEQLEDSPSTAAVRTEGGDGQ
jgi:hypothetical protein